MRRFQSFRQVDSDFDHSFDGKRALLNQVLQCFAIYEFHGDERAATLFGDLINRADITVVQRGSRARLAAETLQRRAVVGETIRQELKCYKSAEQGVFGLVYHAHAPTADLL